LRISGRYVRINVGGDDIMKAINSAFFDTWSEPMAYVLGFIWADGCLNKKSENCYRVAIVNTDKDIVYKIKEVIESDHKVTVVKQNGYKDAYLLEFSNKGITKRLMDLGLTERKSLTKPFPQVPEEYVRHFIRGYFDGNGTIYSMPKNSAEACIYTGSQQFFLVLLDKLYEIGLKKIRLRKRRVSLFGVRFSVTECKNFYNIIYKDATIFMGRKKARFVELIPSLITTSLT
jgi:hypothetical protein